jgi:hypothetical protein
LGGISKEMPVLFSKFEMQRSGFLQRAKVFAFCPIAIMFAGSGSRSVSRLTATSLTRAWLATGPGNVISSRWAVPDDSGERFSALRHKLGPGGLPPAEALRAAQLEMVHSGGWRARPQFWGAYFAMGKE